MAKTNGKTRGASLKLKSSKTVEPAPLSVAEIDRPEGVTISRDDLNILRMALDRINFAFKAMYDLSRERDDAESEPFVTAIENFAVLGCRRCDVIAQLTGDNGYGNFTEEVSLSAARQNARHEREMEALDVARDRLIGALLTARATE